MSRETINHIILFFVALLAQVLIFNNVVLFSVAIPFVFIYFIIRMPLDTNDSLLLTLAFVMGLTVDLFSDSLGVNALSASCLAMLKKPIFFAYVHHDDHIEDAVPSIPTMGLLDYMKYLLSLVVIYCTIVFTIEYLSFARIGEIILAVVASSILSFLILLATDSLMIPKREKRL